MILASADLTPIWTGIGVAVTAGVTWLFTRLSERRNREQAQKDRKAVSQDRGAVARDKNEVSETAAAFAAVIVEDQREKQQLRDELAEVRESARRAEEGHANCEQQVTKLETIVNGLFERINGGKRPET